MSFIFTFGGFFFTITRDVVTRKLLFLYVVIEVVKVHQCFFAFFFRKRSYLSSQVFHNISLEFGGVLKKCTLPSWSFQYFFVWIVWHQPSKISLLEEHIANCADSVIVSLLNSSLHLKIAQFQVLELVFQGKLRSACGGAVLATGALQWTNLHFATIQLIFLHNCSFLTSGLHNKWAFQPLRWRKFMKICFLICTSGSHQAQARLPGGGGERTDQTAGHRDAAAGDPRCRRGAGPRRQHRWVREGGVWQLRWRWLPRRCSG